MRSNLQDKVLRAERLGAVLARILHNMNMWLIIPALIVLVTVDVVLRYVFNASIQGGTEIGGLLLLLVFVASLPYCTLFHGHVYMELVHSRLHGFARTLADLISVLAGLIFMGTFTWASGRMLQDMIKYDEGAMLIDMPLWPFAAAMLVCGVLVTLVFILQLAHILVGLPFDREEQLHE